jgi:hypothetical protein
MKKIFFVFCISIVSLGALACGGSPTSKTTKDAPTTESGTDEIDV